MYDLVLMAKEIVDAHDLKIVYTDIGRPWGGFLMIHPRETQKFVDAFFSQEVGDLLFEDGIGDIPISPKLLLVKPGQRLSWQYHSRRSEYWSLLKGVASFKYSPNDEEPEGSISLKDNKAVHVPMAYRHRIIGGEKPSIIAEIWVHEFYNELSDENDIVRIHDDSGRK